MKWETTVSRADLDANHVAVVRREGKAWTWNLFSGCATKWKVSVAACGSCASLEAAQTAAFEAYKREKEREKAR